MIALRPAEEPDLPAIVGLLADDALGRSREAPGSPLAPAYLAGFRAMVARGGRIIVAVDSGTVIGCLQLDLLPGVSLLGMLRAQIEGVRVASDRRGQGIGAALVDEAVRLANVAGAGVVQLTTNLSRTDAQRFYSRHGFVHSHAGMKLILPTAG